MPGRGASCSAGLETKTQLVDSGAASRPSDIAISQSAMIKMNGGSRFAMAKCRLINREGLLRLPPALARPAATKRHVGEADVRLRAQGPPEGRTHSVGAPNVL